jgi:hypothetical protein
MAAKKATDSDKVREIEAGHKWEFWALRINSCINDAHWLEDLAALMIHTGSRIGCWKRLQVWFLDNLKPWKR